jgi:hypothetical protein
MSTCAAAVTSFYSTCFVLPTLYQHVLQRLLHFTTEVSYYLNYIYLCCSGYFILQHWSRITYTMSACAAAVISFYSNRLLFPTLCQHVLQRLFHFTVIVSYFLHYVNMCSSGYFILQHWSRITYTMSTCAAAVSAFFSTGLVLPTVCQHVLRRLVHFSALVSYYLHYVNMGCSGYFILQHGSRIILCSLLVCAAAIFNTTETCNIKEEKQRTTHIKLLHVQRYLLYTYRIV